jgi:hypothetical protein
MTIASQLVTVVEATPGTITATAVPATLGDTFTSIISMDKAVTGYIGLASKAALVVAGMVIQSKRMGGPLNVFSGMGG